jgi:hypothetical protein
MPVTDREALQARAGEFVRGVEELSGVRLAFDVASLGELDGLLAEWIDMASVYDSPGALPTESLVEPIASYVGEVLVQALDAEWLFPPPEDYSFPAIRLKSGQRVDLQEAVAATLHRVAPPAFRKLARFSAAQPRGADVDRDA